MPERLVPSFQMIDHDIDWRDLDTVEELGDAPLFEREVIGDILTPEPTSTPSCGALADGRAANTPF